MTFAYIGTLNQGGTCRMRGEMLRKLLPDSHPVFINTIVPFRFFNRVIQSVGFRFKRGPIIPKVNQHVLEQIALCEQYDFIWVDKAIYLTTETTQYLKSKTKCLIHFSPDTAFYANRSRHLFKCLEVYDYVVTTKSFDVEHYHQYVPKEKLILCTQGYDPVVHKRYYSNEDKSRDLVFIGLCEPQRERIIQFLLEKGVSITLAGHGWRGFVSRYSGSPNLNYIGVSVQNDAYGSLISSAKFSLGLLSKKFQELHTTRTFEIPACGTALLTESNEETRSFFNDDEAIFYESPEELVEKIVYFKNHPDELNALTEKGMQRVQADGRDYGSILNNILLKADAL
jgi:spore maturation protein CgeB